MPEDQSIEATTKKPSPALSVAARSAIFFDHSEHGSGPTRPYLDKVGRQWHVLDSMGDCVAACGFDENAARLIAALLNRERERINEPNARHGP